MIEEWININNEEEFKKLGNFTYVRRLIKEDLNEFSSKNCMMDMDILKVLHITSNSINGLVEKIKVLKIFLQKNYIHLNSESDSQEAINIDKNGNREINNDSYFFKSEVHELIYFLTQLDGEERMSKLKIYKSHYLNKDLARTWYCDISKRIHPDKLCGINIKGANMAMSNLTAIYKSMRNDE